jgi:drug/metabolite transporter (DMT)-like permease
MRHGDRTNGHAHVSAGFGELCSILSALAWAIGLMFYRQLGTRLPPLQLNFLKNLLVLGMLLPAIPLLHGLAVPHFTGMQLAAAIASGVLGIGVADTLYFRALNELGAGRMGILGNFYSPFVIVLSVLVLGERLVPAQLAGFALVTVGVWVAAWPRAVATGLLPAPPPAAGAPHRLRGIALGLLAVVLMAVSVVLAKRVLEAQPLLWVTGWRMLGAIVGMAAIALARGEARAMFGLGGPRLAIGDGGTAGTAPAVASTGIPWGRLALAAFIGQFLAMILWLAGYKFTQASVAAILNETASVFILVLAAIWLKEPLTRRAVCGVVLTLGGVSCMLLAR